jgi:hypothetical protein
MMTTGRDDQIGVSSDSQSPGHRHADLRPPLCGVAQELGAVTPFIELQGQHDT